MNARLPRLAAGAALLALLVATLVPFALLIVFSLRSHLSIIVDFWELPTDPVWANYRRAFEVVRTSIVHSLFVCIVTVAGAVLLGSLSGYAFARHRFPLKNTLFLLLIGVLAIPSLLTIVPLYSIIVKAGLTDSYWGLILPYISGTQLLGILLCRTFFESLPEELFEAARMDGGGELYLYSRIAVQLSVPIMATIGIVTFLSVYNDYLWPAIVLKEQHRTFTMAAVSLNTAGRQDIGLSFAGYVIGSVPTVAVILLGMKYYIDGMVAGAVKA